MQPHQAEAPAPWVLTRREWRARQRRPSASPAVDVAADRLLTDWGWHFVGVIAAAWATALVIGFLPVLTFLNVAALAAAVVGISRPGLGLVGIGMLSVLQPISGPLLASGGLWRWNTVNYLFLVVLIAFLPLAASFKDMPTRFLRALVLIMTAGLFASSNLFVGIGHTFNVVTAFGPLIYCERARHDRNAWVMLGIVNGVLAGVGSLVYFLQLGTLPPLNRNVWSVFPLVALFSICLAFRYTRTAREQMVLGLLAVINCTWTFLSASRGAFVTGVICLLFLVLQVRGVSRRMAVGAVGAVAVIIMLTQFATFQDHALTRISDMLDTTKSESERTSNRSDLALAGWLIFLEKPLVGAGTGSFGHAQSDLALFSWSRTREFAAHSGWVRTLAENGFPGILALSGYVFSFALIGWQRRSRALLTYGLLVTSVLSIMLVSYELEFNGAWLLAAGVTIMLRPDPSPADRRRIARESLSPNVI